MANKFLIEDLNSISLPLSGNDYAVVEHQSATYKLSMQDLYKDALSNRLDFGVSRSKKNGSPNILSIFFKDDNGSKQLLKKVTLQDGMLSAVNFDRDTNHLSLYFNADAVSDAIVVDLNSLEDTYFAGYGLELSDYADNGISGQQFYVVPSSITEITAMSSDINELSGSCNQLCSSIDSKILIDGISAESLCAIHISQDEFYQKVITSTLISNELYVMSSNFINAYGQQVKNLAEPALSDDAATKNYVDASIPSKTSELLNDSGFLTSSDISVSTDKIQDDNENSISANCEAFQQLDSSTISQVPLSAQVWHVYGNKPDDGNEIDVLMFNDGNDMAWNTQDSNYTIGWIEYYPDDWIWMWNSMIPSDVGAGDENATALVWQNNVEGVEYTLNAKRLGTVHLASKEYVSSLIGNIDSILDAINGEVI